MSCRGPARLVVLLGVGALLLAAAATRGVAESALPALPGLLRPTLDGDPNATRYGPSRLPSRTKRTYSAPVGQVPSFAVPSGVGAGKTGFVSTKKKSKSTSKSTSTSTSKSRPTAPKTGAVILSPPGTTLTPRPSDSSAQAVPGTEGGAAAAKSPAAKSPPAAPPSAPGPAKPITPQKPPALTERQDAKDELNALPNTVVSFPKRTPEADPFSQVGLYYGSFLVRPAIEVAGGYDTNPARSSGGKGSPFFNVAPELRVQSDWERHELTMEIRGSLTDYPATPELNGRSLGAKVASRIDVHDGTGILVEGDYLAQTANPAIPGLPADLASLPIYTTAGGTAGVAQRFNHLELLFKGSFTRINWDDSQLTNGQVASNKGRDYNQFGVQGRATYELTPDFKPFTDVAVDTRDYDLLIDAGGVNRDSDGVAAKAGVALNIARTVTGEAAIGYIQRTYKDPTLPDMRGVLVDASLVWQATALTNVKLGVVTTPQETPLVGVSGILSYDAGLSVEHSFRRWLIGTARIAYGVDEYVGSIRQDQRYTVGAGILYKLNRDWQVRGDVRQEWRTSNVPGNNYTATIGTVGLRWQP